MLRTSMKQSLNSRSLIRVDDPCGHALEEMQLACIWMFEASTYRRLLSSDCDETVLAGELNRVVWTGVIQSLR